MPLVPCPLCTWHNEGENLLAASLYTVVMLSLVHRTATPLPMPLYTPPVHATLHMEAEAQEFSQQPGEIVCSSSVPPKLFQCSPHASPPSFGIHGEAEHREHCAVPQVWASSFLPACLCRNHAFADHAGHQ